MIVPAHLVTAKWAGRRMKDVPKVVGLQVNYKQDSLNGHQQLVVIALEEEVGRGRGYWCNTLLVIVDHNSS